MTSIAMAVVLVVLIVTVAALVNEDRERELVRELARMPNAKLYLCTHCARYHVQS